MNNKSAKLLEIATGIISTSLCAPALVGENLQIANATSINPVAFKNKSKNSINHRAKTVKTKRTQSLEPKVPTNPLLRSNTEEDEPDGYLPNNLPNEPWTNAKYNYDSATKTLTITGGSLFNPKPIFRELGTDDVEQIKITGVVRMSGSMGGFFAKLPKLTKIEGLENLDTSYVHSFVYTFAWDDSLVNLDLSKLKTTNLEITGNMFDGCYNLKTVKTGNWDTSNVVSMGSMFQGCSSLETVDVDNWDTSKVTNMGEMFIQCYKLNHLNVSKWNTGKVTKMAGMFQNCQDLTELDVKNWDMGSVTDMSFMFNYCYKLDHLDVKDWNVSKVQNMEATFQGCHALATLDVSKWLTGNATNMYALFNECEKIDNLDVTGWNTSKVIDMGFLFSGCNNLNKVNVSQWNTQNVINFSAMFQECQKMTTIPVGDWNTSNGQDFSWMFNGCNNLTALNVTNWQTGNATTLDTMFQNCNNLAVLDVSQWNTSKVTDISWMFNACYYLKTLAVANWDTSNVTDMTTMFQNCIRLENLDVSNWQTDKVTNLSWIFNHCHRIKEFDLSKWNTVNCQDFSNMFFDCTLLNKLDISNFNDQKATDRGTMLMYLPNLNELTVGKDFNLADTGLNTPVEWVTVGQGTAKRPQGTEYLSSKALTNFWHDQEQTQTWVPSQRYHVTIKFYDTEDQKTLGTLTTKGNSLHLIDIKADFDEKIKELTTKGYKYDRALDETPWQNNALQLPENINHDVTYQIGLKHKVITVKPDQENPLTHKPIVNLSKEVKQTIHYQGTKAKVADNVQTVTFKRNAQVDLVTGKITYLDWNKQKQQFKDIVSPIFAGYDVDQAIVTGITVTPASQNIEQTVNYTRSIYQIKINYVDLDNDNKLLTSDTVYGNSDMPIDYNSKLQDNLTKLAGYELNKLATTLPLDKDNKIVLPKDKYANQTYTIGLKHQLKTIKPNEKNPLTDKKIADQVRTIKQIVTYRGANKDIPNNEQELAFTRNALVDMVTGKVQYLVWNEPKQSFNNVTSPEIKGYQAKPLVITGKSVNANSQDIKQMVNYERSQYQITINYVDNLTGKVIKSDKVSGNPEKIIPYQKQLANNLAELKGYQFKQDKNTLPLNDNDDLALPDSVLGDTAYTISLDHEVKTFKAGEVNPFTHKADPNLTKNVTQIIKYTGANQNVPDKQQTLKFTRNAQVDMVTGKVTYWDWNKPEQTFKDIDSPLVTGYDVSPKVVAGATVKPTDTDITKTVHYTRANYDIKINYIDLDNDSQIIKTDTISGNPEKAIAYHDQLKQNLKSLSGYQLKQKQTTLPLDQNNNVKLPNSVLGNKTYEVTLNHQKVKFDKGEVDPFTNQIDPKLTKEIRQTIKYAGSPQKITDHVQKVNFTRSGIVDMVTGKVTYSDWDNNIKYFKAVPSPVVKGYHANPEMIAPISVKSTDNNINELVSYTRSDYDIKINYLDLDTNKIVKVDTVKGNPEKIIAYQEKLKQALHELAGFKLNQENTNLPLDKNNNIALPNEVLENKTYTIALTHRHVQIKPNENNPVTGEPDSNLIKAVKQTIKYQGANNKLPDHKQTVTFVRAGDVDLVTGNVIYSEWDAKEKAFATITSPEIASYEPNQKLVKGSRISPTSNDQIKYVVYNKVIYPIVINYIDSHNDQVVKTDKLTGKAGETVAYHGQLKNTLINLKGYKIAGKGTNLPLNEKQDLVLPPDLAAKKTYQIKLAHRQRSFKAGEVNPFTHKADPSLVKTVKQIVKYQGTKNNIPDNVQKVTFTRTGTVDMVTGKVKYSDWDSQAQSFTEVVSSIITGYDVDIPNIKSNKVLVNDNDIIRTVTYTKKAKPAYNITINYVNSAGKIIKTDKQKGKAGTIIPYKKRLSHLISKLAKQGYTIALSKSNLPLDKNDDIQLPANLTSSQVYQVRLENKFVTFKADEPNPLTHKLDPNLTKTVTQKVKYQGVNLPDNVQTVKFTRNATVDMVTSKVTYLDWNEPKKIFKEVVAPTVKGYTPDTILIKENTVTPTSSDIIKVVSYQKVPMPKYHITIKYVTAKGKVLATDKLLGQENSTIDYQKGFKKHLQVLIKRGYEIDNDTSTLPIDHTGMIKLGKITSDTTYQITVKPKIVTFNAGEVNPITHKLDSNLIKVVKQTIHYTGANKYIPDNVQQVVFTRQGYANLATKAVTYSKWNSSKQSFAKVNMPQVAGYRASSANIASQTVTPQDKDTMQTVHYVKNDIVQTGVNLNNEHGKTIFTLLATLCMTILGSLGFARQKNKNN